MAADTLAANPLAAAYPAHWRMARLGEVCDLRGETVQPPFDHAGAYVGLEHIDGGNPRLERWESAASVVSAKARFQPGDVLYGKLRPYLDKAVLAESEGVCSTDILVLETRLGLDSMYLSYLIHTHRFIDAAIQSTSGVTLPRTSWNTLAKAEFPLPPLPEQRAIARVLHAAQEAIAARRRQVTLERERKAALMQRLFAHGVRSEPTQQTVIGEMPQSWQAVELRDFLREPLKNGVSAPEASTGEGIRTLTLSAVTKDDFSIGNTKVTTADPMRVRDLWLENGDLFIERANTSELVGSAAMYYGPDRFAIYPDLLIRVRTCDEWLCAGYLLEYLCTEWCRSYFRRNARGTAGNMPKIDHETVRKLLLPLPSQEEQLAIAEAARAFDAHIAALEREIALHDELFRALLEELMSGRLSALELVEEVAAD